MPLVETLFFDFPESRVTQWLTLHVGVVFSWIHTESFSAHLVERAMFGGRGRVFRVFWLVVRRLTEQDERILSSIL